MSGDVLSIDQIRSNYHVVLERIRQAAVESGREPNAVKLVVVSKEKSVKIVENAVNAGISIFGENYAEEAIPKINAFKSCTKIQWHMIGHVQSRKARAVVNYFDYIHSVDSVKLARRLNRFAQENDKKMEGLIEFNTGGEESKYGLPAWKEDGWDELLPAIEKILELPFLHIHGLMTVPPFFTDPEKARPFFQLLARLKSYLQSKFPEADWSELSMGMSADFNIAIQEGATWIRVGQAILGKRD